MKKIVLLIISLIFSLTSMCGFSNQVNKTVTGVENVDIKKVNIPYSIRSAMSIVIDKNFIETKYGKPTAVKKTDGYTYELRSMDDGGKIFVIYDKQYSSVIDMWQLNKLLKHDEFGKILKRETNFEDIVKIDKYALLMRTDEKFAISEHKLVNNEIAIITYIKKNNNWIVDNLKYIKPDPSNFASIILPEDIKTITLE